jgi:DNA repair photolyase
MYFKWSLNPYMGCVHRCTYCYVRAFEKRADRPFDDRYGVSIRVKTNVAQVLRAELQGRAWRRESVAIGAATDPYQPAEGAYKLTRGCLQALCNVHNPISLITRSPMIVRDADLLQEASRRAEVGINFSVPTLDEDIWRKTEPGTAPPRQRLRALAVLRRAGVRAGVAMAPLLPGISDKPELITEVVKAARDAGASHLWANVLFLRPGTREHFLSHLARDWPDLLPSYRQLYASTAYLDAEVTEPILRPVAELRELYGLSERQRIEDLKPAHQPMLEL